MAGEQRNTEEQRDNPPAGHKPDFTMRALQALDRLEVPSENRESKCHDSFAVTFHDIAHNVMIDPGRLILASLAEGDKHGYAMMEDIAKFAGVSLGPGTLYGAIARLEERGWIRPTRVLDRRKPYTLTAAGRRHLAGELDAFDRVVSKGRAGLSQA